MVRLRARRHSRGTVRGVLAFGAIIIGAAGCRKGGIRLVTVSRPCERESARGLIMTLSNPSGMQFTPASAPIVHRPARPQRKAMLI
jgi:hypothetical protein